MSVEFLRHLAWMLAGLAVAVFFSMASVQLQRNGDGIAATNAEVQRAAKIVADYTDAQTKILSNEKNQKAIEAGWQTPAVVNGAVKLLVKTTIPRVNSNLDSLQASTDALNAAIWETKAAMAINFGHMSEILVEAKGATEELRGTAKGLRLLAEQTGASVPEIAAEFKELIATGKASTEQVNKLLADPNLPALLAQAERLLRESGDVAANLSETTAQLPPILATAKRWQNPLNVARIVSVLLGIL